MGRHLIGRINIVNMSILPKVIYRFNAIPFIILKTFFIEVEKAILKFLQNHRRLWTVKAILNRSKIWRHYTSWSQNILQSYSERKQVLVRMYGKGHSCILLPPLWTIVEEVPQKIRNRTTIWSRIPFLDIYPKEWKLGYLRNSCSPLLIAVYSWWPRYTI